MALRGGHAERNLRDEPWTARRVRRSPSSSRARARASTTDTPRRTTTRRAARFASRFRAVAGFRDVLVHGYLEVDLARVHAVLNMHLVDFREFAEYVRIYLATVDEHS
jgi:hypothetical protein